jgi:cysteine desulfurase
VSGAVYLDHAATTPTDSRVAAAMAACLAADGTFGNPSSVNHDFGSRAHALVETARAGVAAAAGAEPADVIWTSGATEANNLAIFGVAHHERAQGRHLVTARTEHRAVLDPCRELERRGWRVTYLVPARSGLVDPAAVADALRPDTVLVSIMHVNNEIGVIQDIAAIAAACAAHGGSRLHVDAAQSLGKCEVDFGACGADLMSLSAHKAYGPKGVGALLVSRRRAVRIAPLLYGGSQERGLRAGTVATHQVVGMATALGLLPTGGAADAERSRSGALRERLWSGLEALGGVLRNGAAAHCVAQILNVSFEQVEGESLLAAIRPHLAVSSGSACASANREPSYVLRALGRDPRLAEASLRFGLGRSTSEADIDTAVGVVAGAVQRLRRIAGVATRNARTG